MKKRLYAAIFLILRAGTVSIPAELALLEKPGLDLSLQMASFKDVTPIVGPAPVSRTTNGLAWKAADLLSSARGSISFRVKLEPRDQPLWLSKVSKTVASPQTVCLLTGTGGGEWLLNLWENPYVEPEKKDYPKEVDFGDLMKEKPSEDRTIKALEDGDKPASSFVMQAGLKLMARGLEDEAVMWQDVSRRGEWHHVVWTWESVNHTMYLDGKPAGGGQILSRLQPGRLPEATLRLLAGNKDVADFRIYRRALRPEEVQLVSAARLDQYLPENLSLSLSVDWARLSGRAIVYADLGNQSVSRMDITFVDGAGKILKQVVLDRFPDGLGEIACQVTDGEKAFPEGTYHVEAKAFAADGTAKGSVKSVEFKAGPLEAPYKDYIGARAGAEDKNVKIIPPYTPITVKGTTLGVSMREHRLERNGLPGSIVAAGQELLDGPVTFNVMSGSALLDFSKGTGLSPVVNKDDEADWIASSETADGHRLEIHGHMEYDGVIDIDVRLTPKGSLVVDSAAIRIPLREETLKLIHSSGSGFIQRFMKVDRTPEGAFKASHISWNYGSTNAPARPDRGVIFDSFYNHEQINPDRVCSFVHVGNFHRGLSWFMDNDKGWLNKPGVPNMEIVAASKERCIQLNVVAGRATLSTPLEFRFYLLANPFKPMPKDWRTWTHGNRRTDRLELNTKYMWWFHWSEYATGFQPYPYNYEESRDKFKKDSLIHAPFINFGTPGGSGLFLQETKVLPFTWKVHNSRPHRDYVAYWLDRSIRDIGIRGYYVDEPYGEVSSYNVLASDGPYIAEDGTRRIGFRWMEGRAYFRRLKQVLADDGVDIGGVWAHTTHWKGFPYFTFMDLSMDGEWPQIWIDPFYDYVDHYWSLDLNRGYLAGQAYGYVGMQMFHGNYTIKKYPMNLIASRTFLGCTLPCGVLPFPPSVAEELHRVNNIRYDAGIAEDEFIEDVDPFEINGLRCGGFINKKRNLAILFLLAAATSGKQDLSEVLDRVPYAKNAKGLWNAENGESLMVDGRKEIVMDHHAFGVVLARGGDTRPGKPRPNGRAMSASFDAGVEPDYGADIAPVVAEGKPAFAEGKTGKALVAGQGNGSVSYPIVPGLEGGALEFDLKLVQSGQVNLVRIRHYMDVDLHAGAKGELPGLTLTAREGKGLRSKFFPLAGKAMWNRIRLSWRGGHFELSSDGTLIGSLDNPLEPSFQDAEFPAYGLVVGDPAGEGKALIDSLVVFERSDEKSELRGWLWGKGPDFSAAAHFADMPERFLVERVIFTLHDSGNTNLVKASAETIPFRGYAQVNLKPNPKTAMMITDKANVLNDDKGLGDDLLSDLETPSYDLKIDLVRTRDKKQEVLASRTIKIQRGQ